ncbi:uncharacterized protein [Ptychodera flava]|uniref:uncharacterized protein n=1 Tax=Ptychodera flava TaxID=63121 RepID=UPI00396A76D1
MISFFLGSYLDSTIISLTCGVFIVIVVVGNVLGVLLYNKCAAKNQNSNTDYSNAGPDTSDYAEIHEYYSCQRQETGLSEAIDFGPFVENTVENFQHVDGQCITASRITHAGPQRDITHDKLELTTIGSRVQQNQSQSIDTEQMQYASLQPVPTSEYQSLKKVSTLRQGPP